MRAEKIITDLIEDSKFMRDEYSDMNEAVDEAYQYLHEIDNTEDILDEMYCLLEKLSRKFDVNKHQSAVFELVHDLLYTVDNDQKQKLLSISKRIAEIQDK